MNGMIEADIYGNVNSTHVMGSRIQNGIGAPETRPQRIPVDLYGPSTAQQGTISTICAMVSQRRPTEHDVQVIVTEPDSPTCVDSRRASADSSSRSAPAGLQPLSSTISTGRKRLSFANTRASANESLAAQPLSANRKIGRRKRTERKN